MIVTFIAAFYKRGILGLKNRHLFYLIGNPENLSSDLTVTKLKAPTIEPFEHWFGVRGGVCLSTLEFVPWKVGAIVAPP